MPLAPLQRPCHKLLICKSYTSKPTCKPRAKGQARPTRAEARWLQQTYAWYTSCRGKRPCHNTGQSVRYRACRDTGPWGGHMCKRRASLGRQTPRGLIAARDAGWSSGPISDTSFPLFPGTSPFPSLHGLYTAFRFFKKERKKRTKVTRQTSPRPWLCRSLRPCPNSVRSTTSPPVLCPQSGQIDQARWLLLRARPFRPSLAASRLGLPPVDVLGHPVVDCWVWTEPLELGRSWPFRLKPPASRPSAEAGSKSWPARRLTCTSLPQCGVLAAKLPQYRSRGLLPGPQPWYGG